MLNRLRAQPNPRNSGVDKAIWECVCDTFPTNKGFATSEAVESCRKHVPAVSQLSYDAAYGRVFMALRRIEPTTDDLRVLTILEHLDMQPVTDPVGEIWWVLPGGNDGDA